MMFDQSIYLIFFLLHCLFAGGIRCVKNVTIHSTSILSINAGEHWLGIGAADNSMSLFHRPQERLGSFSSTGSKMAGWQLYRTPQRTVAMVYIMFLLILMHAVLKSCLVYVRACIHIICFYWF